MQGDEHNIGDEVHAKRSHHKKDNRAVAEKVLQEALDVVMKQRQNAHGDAESSFQMIADFWAVYINHVAVQRGSGQTDVALTAADVAFMMDLLKTCRAVCGNGTHADHYIDKAGYTSLAAMLMGVK